MKFEKSMYKSAMDKIDNPEKRKVQVSDMNQKYKADVLSGKINDHMAGWDAAATYYDNEMLVKEYNRKMVVSLLFIAVGLIALIFLWPSLTDSINLKINGVKERAYYGWSNDLHDYGYIYRWTYADGSEVKVEKDDIPDREEQKKMELENEEKVGLFTCLHISEKVYLILEYDKEGADYIRNNELKQDKEGIKAAIKEGIEPMESYIYVELNISPWDDGKKGKYVDLYYLPQKGETYIDSRLVGNWVFDIAALTVLVVYNLFWIGRLMMLGKKQRALM